MAVTYLSTGAGSGGTGTLASVQVNQTVDSINVLLVATTGETPTVPAGWNTLATSAGQGTPGAVGGLRLFAFWRRMQAGDPNSVTVTFTGNNIYARVIAFSGAKKAGNPIDTFSMSQKTTASTALAIPGVTAFQGGNDLLYVSGQDTDNAAAIATAEANSSLTGLAERIDAGIATANGAHISAYTGNLAAAGASGTTTATLSGTNSNTVEDYLCVSFLAELPTKHRKTFAPLGTRIGSRQLQGA